MIATAEAEENDGGGSDSGSDSNTDHTTCIDD